jgi:hypothetical protein
MWAFFQVFRMPQVPNQDPEIGLEMLPSHQNTMAEKSEAVIGISKPYFGQESQELIDFESPKVVAGQLSSIQSATSPQPRPRNRIGDASQLSEYYVREV